MITHRDVQDALRDFHSEEFRAGAVAKGLERLYPAQNAREAFLYAVASAFGDSDGTMRDLIVQHELERPVSRTIAAQRCGLSVRSLFRKRRDAIAKIAAHLDNLLSIDDLAQDVLRAAPGEGPAMRPAFRGRADRLIETRFAFEEQCIAANIPMMEYTLATAATYLRRSCGIERVDLDLMGAEIAIKKGNVERAQQALRAVYATLASRPDKERSDLALLAQARLNFVTGNTERALRLAERAIAGLSPGESAWAQANVLAGRIAAADGLTWHCTPAPGASECDALQLQAVRARHDLLAGRVRHAHVQSARAYKESRRLGSLATAAYAAATIAIAYGPAQPVLRDRWAITALKLLASCGNAADVAHDLFQTTLVDARSGWLTHASERDMCDLYSCVQPGSDLLGSRTFHRFASALVRAIVQNTPARISADATHDKLVELASAAANAAGGVAPIAKELPALFRMGDFIKVLWPAHAQAHYGAQFNFAAGRIVRAVTRSVTRRQIRALSNVS